MVAFVEEQAEGLVVVEAVADLMVPLFESVARMQLTLSKSSNSMEPKDSVFTELGQNSKPQGKT